MNPALNANNPASSITNYLQISDQLASSGQPEENQFKLIKNEGYDVVINLAMPNSENVIPEEGNIVTAYGMSYVNIPVPWEAPTKHHLEQFFGVMRAFEGKKIWVHCVKNFRVSAFLYQYYRLVLEKPEEQSKAVIFEGWEPIEIWQDFMELEI